MWGSPLGRPPAWAASPWPAGPSIATWSRPPPGRSSTRRLSRIPHPRTPRAVDSPARPPRRSATLPSGAPLPGAGVRHGPARWLVPDQLAVGVAVGAGRFGAQAAGLVGLVVGQVALEPGDAAVAFEGEHVGGDPVQEPAVVADHDHAAGEGERGALHGARWRGGQ